MILKLRLLCVKYDVVKNALKALNAGCNLALYCKGSSKESLKLLKKIPPIVEFTKKNVVPFVTPKNLLLLLCATLMFLALVFCLLIYQQDDCL